MIVPVHRSLLLAYLLGSQVALLSQVHQEPKVTSPVNVPAARHEAGVSLYLSNVPISEALSVYEGLTGLKILPNAEVGQVRVSIVSGRELTKEIAIQFIEKSLLFNGYALLPTEAETIKLLAVDEATKVVVSRENIEKLSLRTETASQSEGSVELNFPETPISNILLFYEDLTGLLIIREAGVEQTLISVVGKGELTRGEAIKLIEKNFLLNGYFFAPAGTGMVKLLTERRISETKTTQQVLPQGDATETPAIPRRRQLISTPSSQPTPQQ